MDCHTNNHENYLTRNSQPLCVKPNEFSDSHALYNDILCGCGVKSARNISVREPTTLKLDSYEWSRIGPMGYLIEPKLYPINVCSLPIDDECFSQEIGPILPPVNILRRINDDRLRSTYKTDFSHMDDYPWVDYDNLMISAGYKIDRMLKKKSQEEIKCRRPVKLPSLNGHRIPGRRSKDFSSFGSFGRMYSKTKRSGIGPEGTSLPLKPVRLPQVSLKSRGTNYVVGVDKRNSSDYESNQMQMLNNVNNVGKNQILNNVTDNGDLNLDKQILTSKIGVFDNIIDSKSVSNGHQRQSIHKDTKNTWKDKISNSVKIKETGNELQLISSIPWTSEYQDIISRTADEIIRTKLYHYGKIRLTTPDPDCL